MRAVFQARPAGSTAVSSERDPGALAVLALFSLYCVGLEIARVLYTHDSDYEFLIWNLFLAWIPFALSSVLAHARRRGIGSLRLTLVGLLWLLFLPNAPYIVTDFVHLRDLSGAPLWYDVVLIASFAFTGILLGFVSLERVQRIVAESAGAAVGWLVAVVALVLSAFGIFIGRFEVHNSWDVIAEPVPLARETWQQLTSPSAYPRTLGVTASYAVFLLLAYVAVRVLTGSAPTPVGGDDPRSGSGRGSPPPP